MTGAAWIVVTGIIGLTVGLIFHRYFEHIERLERYSKGIKNIDEI